MTGSKWEVWFAWVGYEDKPGEGKQRPVVIYENKVYFIAVYPCTSHAPRGGLDYQLRDYKQAGLHKPTVVRLGYGADLTSMNFVHRIGQLSEADIMNITSLLRQPSDTKKEGQP